MNKIFYFSHVVSKRPITWKYFHRKIHNWYAPLFSLVWSFISSGADFISKWKVIVNADYSDEELSKNDVLRRFIETYESLPELWNGTHAAYTNKTRRNAALDKLIPIFSAIKPGAKREDVRKKINSLRTNFRKDLKKIVASKRSGAGAGDVYCPSSWTFEALKFLEGNEQPVPVQKLKTVSFSNIQYDC